MMRFAMDTAEYSVPGMHCGHCKAALEEELGAARGVQSVDVDLQTKRVLVRGRDLDDSELRAAIEEAGHVAV
jgi:copper chaperone